MTEQIPFWRRKSLSQMTPEEWESLCDGCGKCCLIKLEEVEEEKLYFTDVACHLLNCESCRCRDYKNRQRIVEDCVVLTPKTIEQVNFMPSSCAYRLLAEGKDLYWWHHLVCGDFETVHQAGMSARGRAVSEKKVPDAELEDHIVDWPS
ncbi:MAG: YcgN family cysteine cluster protein [Pseudomonadota bacterium]